MTSAVAPGAHEHLQLDLPGLSLHAVREGPLDAPAVILLHGFPEFWYGWRKQIGPLAAAGYCVIAPDQRGYNQSSAPPGLRAYHVERLAEDMVHLLDHAGIESAWVVGHDWGAGVAWWLALRHPTRVRGLVILNGPHPVAMARAWRRGGRQRRLSWYMLLFQLPWLPEALIRARQMRPFSKTLQRSARPGTLSDEELRVYREAWSRPGKLTAMLNWYRALRFGLPRLASWMVRPPTLILWGVHDTALDRSLARASAELCEKSRVVFFEEATHWVHLEEAEQVNREMIQFFRDPETSTRVAAPV